MMDYSDDKKVCIRGKLKEYMEIYMYQRSRSFFDIYSKSLIFH